MLNLDNATPFPCATLPGLDKEGNGMVTAVLRGTFRIGKGVESPPLAEDQAPLVLADAFWGEPGASSLRYEADTSPLKRTTDIALVGHAYAPKGKARSVDVTVQTPGARKAIRVVGDRVWFRAVGVWEKSEPVPFDRMPLVYERAFGGADAAHEDPARHGFEKRNPVGTGFCVSGRKERLDNLPLPNLEDPAHPIRGWEDRPAPAGPGFIARSWMPRLGYAGTYDEAWRRDRCPLLPDDFDDRFFNAAHPDLLAPRPLEGGEIVRVTGASPSGDLVFRVPAWRFDLSVVLRGRRVTQPPVLDTLLIEPDDGRLTLVWRAPFPCGRDYLLVDDITVRGKAIA